MIARRRMVATAAVLCALAGVSVVGVNSASAAFLFGSLGSEAGQINDSQALAIDSAGNLYASDFGNDRIDRFGSSGIFAFAWGWGVLNRAPEPQTCTTSCEAGLEGVGTAQFDGNLGVAVDNELANLSYGDVYVVSRSGNEVEKFNASGEFMLAFGGHVNRTSGGNVCVAGEACQDGTQGTADGEFELESEGSYLAVGPAGRVYVGDRARVQVFEPSGIWKENISLAGLSSTGRVKALAVDSTGDVYVADSEASGVREFEADGAQKGSQLDEGSTSVKAIALNASGDVFVSDTGGRPHFLEYDSSAKELESYGSRIFTFISSGMVFDNSLGELLVYGSDAVTERENQEPGHLGVWSVDHPSPGPLLESNSESALAGQRGHASLEATINPEGDETTYHFEYIEQAQFEASGYASASSTTAVSIGASFDDQTTSTSLTGLTPGATYHYRVVAANSQGTTIGPDQTVEPIAPMLVEGPWATNVASTSATFAVKIDPLGASTTYRLEYGTSSSYGQVLSGNVGAGEGYVLVSYHSQELLANTVYHYRIVTSNEVGTIEGEDRTLTTEVAGGNELTLPDGRAWELVSPADKAGGLIDPFSQGMTQAEGDGNGITYLSTESLGEDIVGKSTLAQLISTRTPAGWRTQDVSVPHELPDGGRAGGAAELANGSPSYQLFSPDLTFAAVEPLAVTARLSAEAKERTPYLRNNANDAYLPLVTEANVTPPGTKFGGTEEGEGVNDLHFVAGTPDLEHIVVESPFPLTSEAPAHPPCQNPLSSQGFCPNGEPRDLYEWSAGELQLVNILPNGEPLPGSEEAYLGRNGKQVAHAISNDGRRIVWSREQLGVSGGSTLYVRDMVEKKTFQLGKGHADVTKDPPLFQTMSSDGSRIFFLEGGELYEFDMNTRTQVDLTARHGAGESSAGVQDALLGASKDGSYVYFVAKGVLADGAVSGGDNLYLLHDDGNEWTTTFLATLSAEDHPSWFASEDYLGVVVNFSGVASRVSPSGRYLEFMSSRPLTGYDNRDAVSGQPDEEIYLYDAVTNRLVCASCNPTGARPSGVFDRGEEKGLGGELVVDRHDVWGVGGNESVTGVRDHWLAANVPGWYAPDNSGNGAQYQPRYLSDSGRLFFDSADALVPQDTNGLEDVYEYEPAGVGDCTTGSVTFSERSQGCVGLITSGTSASESVFLDASESGDDVFFITSSRLSGADYDTSPDVYDAHVCSEAVPCNIVPVSSPPCTSGDSCKAAPSPQPAIFGPTPSATFSGIGNVIEDSKKSSVKHKPKLKKKKVKAKAKKRRKQKKGKGKKASRSRAGRTSGKGGK